MEKRQYGGIEFSECISLVPCRGKKYFFLSLLVSTSKCGPCLCTMQTRQIRIIAFKCGYFDTLTCSYSPNRGQSVTR